MDSCSALFCVSVARDAGSRSAAKSGSWLTVEKSPSLTMSAVSSGTHARGVIYSVHAQDLLQGIGELSRDEQERLDTFHRNMFETIRSIHN